jgi:large subunit ribosomal protein L4
MQTKVYNVEGKVVRDITIPDAVFGAKWNSDLVHQVVKAMEANARVPVAHTKDRSEVSGTGKKPWKQKGTGQARHGSRRSPIWRKGGIAHGPRSEKVFAQKINKRMRTTALYSVLSRKLKDGELLFVDAMHFESPKTKDAKAMIAGLAAVKGFESLTRKRKNAAFIALGVPTDAAKKSFNNFGNIEVDEARNLNPVDILKYKYLILADPETTVTILAKKTEKKA